MKKKLSKKLRLRVETVSNLNDVVGGRTGNCDSYEPTYCVSDGIPCTTESTPLMSGCYTQCGTCPPTGGGLTNYKCPTDPLICNTDLC